MTDVLITGGTGSLGYALVMRLLRDTSLKRIIVFSRDELKQSEMATRFAHAADRLRFFLGDVRDAGRLRQAIPHHGTVIHAAALKRVDAGSYNPGEIRRTNVDGTENVCRAAIDAGAARVLTISSDKAVQPTNIYGASKMLAEHLTTYANVQGFPRGTRSACVRYGNVLGSRGSVLGVWREAVRQGKPIRLTDLRMTRFWLTLDNAVDLVLYALAYMQGGEIFVPQLRATRMLDLAQVVGGQDYPVETIGLRPGGEKLHESLLGDHEHARTRTIDDVHVVTPEMCEWQTPNVWNYGKPYAGGPYTSDTVPAIDAEELRRMAREVV